MNDSSGAPGLTGRRTGRLAGGVLLTAAILILVAMGHHPTGHEAPAAGPSMTLGGFVHATMIALLAATTWALVIFSARRGWDGWTLAAVLAYGTGFAGSLTAGMINGFLVPAVAVAVDPATSGDIFQMLWQGNQVAAKLGVYASSLAFLIWSICLVRRQTTVERLVGGIGILVALAPAGALFSGVIMLDVDGALLVYGLHAGWTGFVGIHMLRGAL